MSSCRCPQKVRSQVVTSTPLAHVLRSRRHAVNWQHKSGKLRRNCHNWERICGKQRGRSTILYRRCKKQKQKTVKPSEFRQIWGICFWQFNMCHFEDLMHRTCPSQVHWRVWNYFVQFNHLKCPVLQNMELAWFVGFIESLLFTIWLVHAVSILCYWLIQMKVCFTELFWGNKSP